MRRSPRTLGDSSSAAPWQGRSRGRAGPLSLLGEAWSGLFVGFGSDPEILPEEIAREGAEPQPLWSGDRESPGKRRTILRKSMAESPPVRPENWRLMGHTALLVVPIFGAALVFIVAIAIARDYFPDWLLAVIIVGWILVTLGLTYLLTWGYSNFGIVVGSDGLRYYANQFSGKYLTVLEFTWDEIGEPEATNVFNGTIWLSRAKIQVAVNQARLILTDPRFPLRDEIPEKVAKQVGIKSA